MNKSFFIPHTLLFCCMLSCGEPSSRQSAVDSQDTLGRGEENPYLRVEVASPNNADEYLQAKERQVNKTLEKQLREGANIWNDVTDIPKDAFGIDELQAVTFKLSFFLWNNDYRDIEKEIFAKKVKEIFGKTLPTEEGEHFLYVNLFEPCNNKPFYHRNNGIDYNGFFIISPENFITEFYYLPEIMDYHLYTDLVEMERELPKTYRSDTHNEQVLMEKWMELEARNDEYSLERQRKFNRQLILNRNRFLFKNDNSRLPWLLDHDRFFMESLIKRFGWTNNESLLYQVVSETRFDQSNPDDFGSLFWKKNCDGSVTLHANTFKLLQTRYAPGAPDVLLDIRDYLEYMMGSGGFSNYTIPDITTRQKVEILANMVYFAEQYKYKKLDNGQIWSYHKMMGRFRYFLNEAEIKILEDNNYFGLPKFKAWWDAADYDEYIVRGDYEGPWGRDNEPMTEAEWREKIEEVNSIP